MVRPALAASAARTATRAFDAVEPLEPSRVAVGAERFALGFQRLLALPPDGELECEVITRALSTVAMRATSLG